MTVPVPEVLQDHPRCDPADHHHCPRCGGPLQAFAYCPPCGVSVDFRMMPAPSPDMAALLAAREDVTRRAGTGQMIAFVEACDGMGIPPGSRMPVARWLSEIPGLAKFSHLTREQAWTVLNRIEATRKWRDERDKEMTGD